MLDGLAGDPRQPATHRQHPYRPQQAVQMADVGTDPRGLVAVLRGLHREPVQRQAGHAVFIEQPQLAEH
ncbi:hypothetical protein ACBR38_33510 [Streptomyces sp. MAD19A]|uniref:hypothetical protein n=1 Tax=Streptomyces sp. MAD19A TaxID=3242896 RepID=UPI003528FF01